MKNNQCCYLYKRIKKYSSKRTKKKIFIILVCVFLFCFSICVYLSRVVNPILYSYSYAEISKIAAISSNDAIASITKETSYDNFAKIEYLTDGYVSSIKVDIDKLNKVGNLLAKTNQNNLNSYIEKNIKIPIGTLSGIGFLSGKGNKVTISTSLIGNVKSDFYTEFKSVGINQTIHKIYVTLISKISIILPFKNEVVENKLNYLISECVI
ncbi:MAG: hypothetical protein IJD48_00410, partial [Clostridia bacterium]|nr:hypothetical protein [Clostridia bacterium]